jgi:hypothetical protein
MKRAPIKNDVSVEYLRKIFDYDPLTGVLFHKKRHAVLEGSRAGFVMNHGYVGVKIHQRLFLAHRVIWAWVTGVWPELDVDHENLVRTDNRWSNLRVTTRSSNVANSRARSNHLKGAYRQRNGKWQSQIQENGRYKYLGTFLTELEANLAYAAAAKLIHGEFARA